MSTTTPTKIFKCVPLDTQWVIPGTKLDLKAIYRRPRRSVGEFDEIIQERGPDGLPLYDLTGPLPLRRHSDWIAKGFEYVTVVASPRNAEDPAWGAVAGSLRAKALNPSDYLQHPAFGTWNPKLYMATADIVDREKLDELTRLVEMLGSAAVLAVRQSTEPGFTLPPSLQNIPAGGKAKTLDPTIKSTATAGEVTDRAAYESALAEGTIAEIPPGSTAAKRVAAGKKAAAAKRDVQP